VKEYLITSKIFDRQRKLVLAEDYLEWENGNLKGQEFVRISKSQIKDFKHGMHWIVWYKFTVGQKFSIAFKDKKNKEVKVVFKSYFGLHKENYQKYLNIVDDVWSLYYSNIVDKFLDSFYNEGKAEIQGIKLTQKGIELKDKGLVIWDKVAIKDYDTYFSVYNRDDPKIHFRMSYNEYGTEMVWSAIKTILKAKVTNAVQ
jgi:hypothetical protein